MRDTQLMDIVDTVNDLVHKFASFDLLQPSTVHDIIKQFPPICVLHYHVDEFTFFDDLTSNSNATSCTWTTLGWFRS